MPAARVAALLLAGAVILSCDVRIPEAKRPHAAGPATTPTPGSQTASAETSGGAPGSVRTMPGAPVAGTAGSEATGPGRPATGTAEPTVTGTTGPTAPATDATPSPGLEGVPYGAGTIILPGTICGAIAWGGIVPGVTLDADLMTLFGPGLFDKAIGGGGARVYTDRGGTLTARFVLGPGAVVSEIDLRRGFVPPAGAVPEARRWMTSPRIRPDTGLYGPGVRFGADAAALLKAAGAPRRQAASDAGKAETWSYTTGGQPGVCEAGPEVLLRFEAGRLARVTYRAHP